MNELISVIVPVYNISGDLPNCLDSILTQTYPDIEIIAINDGSTDNSGEILECYAESHPNLRVIHKENGGVTSARLRGVREASGEWIGFVDGDDEIEKDMYERLIKNAKAYDAQISHCGYQLRLPDGRVNYFYNTGILAKHDKTTALRELLSGAMIEPGLWNKLYNKTLFHSMLHENLMPENIRINEDLLMNFYLFSAADNSVFEDWCPYHYVAREDSATRSKNNKHKIFDPIQVKEIIRQIAAADIRGDAQRAYINTCINAYNELISSCVKCRDDMQKVRSLLKRESHNYFLLRKKRMLMACMIVYMPALYNSIYWFYLKCLQKNRYS